MVRNDEFLEVGYHSDSRFKQQIALLNIDESRISWIIGRYVVPEVKKIHYSMSRDGIHYSMSQEIVCIIQCQDMVANVVAVIPNILFSFVIIYVLTTKRRRAI